MKKSIYALLMAIVIAVTCLNINACMYDIDETYQLNCKNAIVVNTNTGRVVFEKNADEHVPIASMANIMTAILLIENSDDLDKRLTVKDSTLQNVTDEKLTTINLVDGEKIRPRDLLFSIMMFSAADASAVVAEHIGGSVQGFVDMMNEKAQELGMTQTHFTNAFGLDEEGQYSTAGDIAVMSAYAMENEIFCDVVSKSLYKIPNTNKNKNRPPLYSPNDLLNENSDLYYRYADGITVGHTEAAGRCLISSAEKDSMRYICVVLGCDANNSNGTMAYYNHLDSIYLLEKAFNDYSLEVVCKKGVVAAKVPFKGLGIDATVECVFKDDVELLLSSDEYENIKLDYSIYEEKIKGPVEKDEAVGKCEITLDGEMLGCVEIITTQSVERDNVKVIATVLRWTLAVLIVTAIVLVILIIRSKKKNKGRKPMKVSVKFK